MVCNYLALLKYNIDIKYKTIEEVFWAIIHNSDVSPISPWTEPKLHVIIGVILNTFLVFFLIVI